MKTLIFILIIVTFVTFSVCTYEPIYNSNDVNILNLKAQIRELRERSKTQDRVIHELIGRIDRLEYGELKRHDVYYALK